MRSHTQSDKPDFESVFEDNYEIIYRYLYRRFADEEAAADLASITFIKAYQAYDRYSPSKPVLHWLYTIAGNELKMYFRSHKRYIESLDKLMQDGVEPADSHNMVEELMESETRASRQRQFIQAQQLLLTLPQKYQEVLVLRFNESLSIAEIASVLNKKEGTVKSILSRGLKKLRNSLTDTTVQLNPDERIIASEGQIKKINEAYEE